MTNLHCQRLTTSFSSEDSKPQLGLFFQNSSLKSRHKSCPIQTACSGVWKKFLLLHTQHVHIIDLITSKFHQWRAEEKCLFLFALTLWESASAYAALWVNKPLWWGLRGTKAKSVGCIWQQGWFTGRTCCCRVTRRTSSMWFLLDLCCAQEQQDGLAVGLRNSRDVVGMYSCDQGSMAVSVTGHATRREWHCR